MDDITLQKLMPNSIEWSEQIETIFHGQYCRGVYYDIKRNKITFLFNTDVENAESLLWEQIEQMFSDLNVHECFDVTNMMIRIHE